MEIEIIRSREGVEAIARDEILERVWRLPPQHVETRTIDMHIARLREKLDQVRRADYFAILGLSRRCTPHEIREAADRLAAEFDPGRFEGLPDPELSGMAGEIRRVVAEAREVLSAEDLRREYLAGLGGEDG